MTTNPRRCFFPQLACAGIALVLAATASRPAAASTITGSAPLVSSVIGSTPAGGPVTVFGGLVVPDPAAGPATLDFVIDFDETAPMATRQPASVSSKRSRV